MVCSFATRANFAGQTSNYGHQEVSDFCQRSFFADPDSPHEPKTSLSNRQNCHKTIRAIEDFLKNGSEIIHSK